MRIIGLSNQLPDAPAHRRLLRIPFGRHPHPCGAVQDLNPGTAGKIVAALKIALANGRPPVPVYNGHPDDGAAVPADPAQYGRVIDAAVEEGGALALLCELTDAGLALVRSGKRLFSPHWLANVARGVATPFELLSIGLTDRPVMPVVAIANQKPSASGGEKGVPMRDLLIALLKQRGIEIPPDADDAALAALLEAQFKKDADALAAKDAELTNLKGEADSAKADASAEKGKAEEAAQSLANERKERRALLLDVALSDGRVPPAARKTWEGEFERDFPGTVVKLANAQPVMKVTPKSTGAAGRQGDADTVGRIVALVNEEVKKTGLPQHDCHLRVKKAHPELFGTVQ